MWTDPNISPEEVARETYEAAHPPACDLCDDTGKIREGCGSVPCPRCSNE